MSKVPVQKLWLSRLKKGYKQLVAEANAAIETLSVDEALNQLQTEDVVFVDIRDLPELERDGSIPGAVHASRGMLEFHVDPVEAVKP